MDRSYLPTRERALPMNEEAHMKNQVEYSPQDEELVPTQLTKSIIFVLISRIRPFDRQLSHFKSEKTDFVCVKTLASFTMSTNPIGLSDTTF